MSPLCHLVTVSTNYGRHNLQTCVVCTYLHMYVYMYVSSWYVVGVVLHMYLRHWWYRTVLKLNGGLYLRVQTHIQNACIYVCRYVRGFTSIAYMCILPLTYISVLLGYLYPHPSYSCLTHALIPIPITYT